MFKDDFLEKNRTLVSCVIEELQDFGSVYVTSNYNDDMNGVVLIHDSKDYKNRMSKIHEEFELQQGLGNMWDEDIFLFVFDEYSRIDIGYYGEDYGICSTCDKAITHNDYRKAHGYYIRDAEFTCNNCILSDEDYKDEYIQSLINEPYKYNDLLNQDEFIARGFTRYIDYNLWDSHKLWEKLTQRYPNAEFVLEVEMSFVGHVQFAFYAKGEGTENGVTL